MKKIPCRKSAIQMYQCTVRCKPRWCTEEICFDACLAKELFYLWDNGIVTTGCCCGKHINSKRKQAYIGVEFECIPKMKELGYEVQFNPLRPDDEDTFHPKSNF